ncbi:hypothetical protein BO70DRAFT_317419, partial [Aspergillus heteromorphus CBS 117.55]
MKLFMAFQQYESVIAKYYSISQFVIIPRPLILGLLASLRRDLENGLNQESLEQLYARTSINTRKPFPTITENTTVEEFLACMTGPRLRWETVGTIFALAGIASFHTKASEIAGKEAFAGDMYAASKACIEICEENGQVNDGTLWMRLTNVILASNLYGDTSKLLYQGFTLFTTDLTIMGLHRQISSPCRVPFFVSETRRRIFAAAFSRDKTLATFLGRPYQMDSRFCDTILPLDLDDEEIVYTVPALTGALQTLDENGWKRSPSPGQSHPLRPATVIRLRYQWSRLRERILRLSLGNKIDDLAGELDSIHQAHQTAWAPIPPQYRYTPVCWTHQTPNACVALLIIHLDYLYTGFQLHRIYQTETEVVSNALLDTSMELVEGMLEFVTQQERCAELRERFIWIFLFYLLPGAGTLAASLHQHTIPQTQTPTQAQTQTHTSTTTSTSTSTPFTPPASTNTSTLPNPINNPLPCSSPYSRIIRSLSVVIAWFENKRLLLPQRSDYQVCLQISRVIGGLVDEVVDWRFTSGEE